MFTALGMRETMSLVQTEIRDGIGSITLKNGKVNALSSALIDEIAAALAGMQPPETRVLILRAARGATVFSAGHDVRELPTNGRDPLTYNDPLRKVVRDIEKHPMPVIAMVEGSVWGGGCELVMSCDLIIASDDSTFALTPAKLGVPYNLSGALNFMKVADIHFIKEMLFTAQPITAQRMAACGVINHIVPRELLEPMTMKMAKEICQTSPLVHRILKEELRVLSNARPMSPEAYERIQSLRREVYDSADYQEGIKAFMEKRAPVFQGK
jgi:methylmalonyl-CoA decarboxylase